MDAYTAMREANVTIWTINLRIMKGICKQGSLVSNIMDIFARFVRLIWREYMEMWGKFYSCAS
jgi:hypothetical protein